MTYYEQIASEMLGEIDLIEEEIRANNYILPTDWLEERYGGQGMSSRNIALGLMAWNRPSFPMNQTKLGDIAKKMVSDGKVIAQAKIDNKGKTPYTWLGKRYGADKSAVGQIAIGILAETLGDQ